jgi:hypothetical protein
MASSYSDLGLELMVTGENAGQWGDKTNSNLNLIQQSIAGYQAVALTDGGTVTLAMTDATLSNARNMVIKFTGTLTSASTVTIPDTIEKFYIFDCSAVVGPTNLTIKTASGTGFTLDAAKIYAAYTDGTNLNEISLDTLGGTVAAANITGTIATSQIADEAVTYAKIQDTTTANRVIGAATAGTVGEVQVSTDMIADDAVTADKLANTTVTAGSYTASSITVDAQGRLTAASSGAGAANMIPLIFKVGPASGSLTLDPSASKVQAFLFAGGGGGAGATGEYTPIGQGTGGNGGTGGFGFYAAPATGGSTIPYSIGAPGAPGAGAHNPGTAGGAGGDTTFHNFAVNGGNGGNASTPGNPGNPGTSPGAAGILSRAILFVEERGTIGTGGSSGTAPGQAGGAGGAYILSNEG